MKLYLYNCNHLNEFLSEIETDNPAHWAGCSTEVPSAQCDIVGKSYAFNTNTQAWDTLIEDWRGVTLYRKLDSRITQPGSLKPKSNNYTEVAPPDNEKRYVWDEENSVWLEYIEMVNPTMIIKQYEDAIQRHIDEVAQARGYDNGYTCASYYDDKNARYASDAQIFKNWRSDVWVYVNTLLNQYSSSFEGETLIPASALSEYPTPEDIIGQLPTIEWQDL